MCDLILKLIYGYGYDTVYQGHTIWSALGSSSLPGKSLVIFMVMAAAGTLTVYLFAAFFDFLLKIFNRWRHL